ncbi:sensor histidine kinase [Salana multivorans]|uniref:sensor histidine kinase n=1 Tax=Salana multivorans TaxID=120377 RepID=UPI000B025C14|nr:HAMP domain-containing sensor histidine kinase [Salana multivorans]
MTAALPGRRPPRRLRTQLTAVVVLTALALALALGLVSTLALRSSLLERIDAQLVAASDRGRDVLPSGGTPVPLPTPDAAGPAGDGPAGDDPAAGDPAAGDQGDGPTPNGFPGTGIPPGLAVRGQAAGTVVVEVRGGEVVDAGYLDETGAVVELTAAQADALLAATAQPGWVDVPGLGRYRAVAAERPTRPAGGADDAGSTGDVAVTALPWSDAAATLERYVVVEVIVGSLAVVLAALAATAVVRRSLRPLDRVAATAQRVSELPLDRGAAEIAERVPARDTDERTEIGMVGAAVNRMLGHVESSLAARHASELKVRAFVADASHELRTPLASIRGYSELVLRRDRSGRGTDAGAVHLDDATRHAVERIASEGGRMQGLVEDLLLLARLDAGRELELAPVDLVAVVAEVVSDAHAAGPRHLWQLDLPGDGDAGDDADADDVDRDTDPDIGDLPLVLADEARLRQVLVNLTANARVHTPPGTRVRVGVAADPATREVLVSVRDDGPGIPPELADTLFDRFTRGETSRTRDADSPSSTGLGLAIAEAIVEAHGGSITVRSVPGDTCVEVRLPAA